MLKQVFGGATALAAETNSPPPTHLEPGQGLRTLCPQPSDGQTLSVGMKLAAQLCGHLSVDTGSFRAFLSRWENGPDEHSATRLMVLPAGVYFLIHP